MTQHHVKKVITVASWLFIFSGFLSFFTLQPTPFSTFEITGAPSQSGAINRTVTITPATSVTDYVIKLDLNSSFNYARCLPSGDDIRFYNPTNTLLSYWIESWNPGSTSTIWIKIPQLGTSSIKMEYGIPRAKYSNGPSTFLFFDDFSGATLDTTKWGYLYTPAKGGIISVNTTQLLLKAGTPDSVAYESVVYQKVNKFNTPVVMETRCQITNTANDADSIMIGLADHPTVNDDSLTPNKASLYARPQDNLLWYRGNGDMMFLTEAIGANRYATFKMECTDTQIIHYNDGVLKTSGASASPNNWYVFMRVWEANLVAVDWVRVMKYTPTPSVAMLSNTNVPGLSGITVEQSIPLTPYNFSVVYSDADDNYPSYIRAVIKGKQYSLAKQNPVDNAYDDGCVYQALIDMNAGTQDYYFQCSDGRYTTSTTTTNMYFDCTYTIKNLTVLIIPSTPVNNFTVRLDLDGTFKYDDCLSSGDDIRFYDAGSVSQSYWIEKWSPGGKSTIWINIRLAGTSTLRMEYGNKTLPQKSNGDATFLFFDDFVASTLDTNKWVKPQSSVGISIDDVNDMVLFDDPGTPDWWSGALETAVMIATKNPIGSSFVVTARMQFSQIVPQSLFSLDLYTDNNNGLQMKLENGASLGWIAGQVVGDGGSNLVGITPKAISQTEWYTYEFINPGSNPTGRISTSAGVLVGQYTFAYTHQKVAVHLSQWATDTGVARGKLDRIFIRKYAAVDSVATAQPLAWIFPTGNQIWSSAAVADVDADGVKEAIFGSDDFKIYCVSGTTGIIEWSYTTTGQVRSTPAIGDLDGNPATIEVVVGSNDGTVYCLNGNGGSLKWSTSTGAGKAAFPGPAICDVEGDGIVEVLTGTWADRFYCFYGTNGSIKWVTPMSLSLGHISSTAACADVDNDGIIEVFFTCFNNTQGIYCLKGNTGAVKWCKAPGASSLSSPAIADVDGDSALDVMVGSDNGTLFCFDANSGNTKWRYVMGGLIRGGPVVADVDGDRQVEVICGSHDDSLYCLSGNNGTKEWSYKTGNDIYGFPSIADLDDDGNLEIVFGSLDNKTYMLSGMDGTLEWSFTTGGSLISSPNIIDIDGDGKLNMLIGSWDAKMYCFKFTGPSNAIPGPWSCQSGSVLHNGVYIDTDKDGLLDKLEATIGLNLAVNDTDGDGCLDGLEIIYGMNPNNIRYWESRFFINGNKALQDFPFKTGAGTGINPYVIQNFDIDAQKKSNGIWLMRTSLPLDLVNCSTTKSSEGNSAIALFAGLRIVTCSNVHISNASYSSNFGAGIYLEGVSTSDISRCKVTNNAWYGIYMKLCSYVDLLSNEIHHNMLTQVLIENWCQHNTIINNTMSNSKYFDGISLGSACNGNTISNNTISNNNQYGINFNNNMTDPIGTLVHNNSISSNLKAGISLNFAKNITITNNHIFNNYNGLVFQDKVQYEYIYLNSIHNNIGSNVLFVAITHSDINFYYRNLGNYWGDYQARYPAGKNNGLFWNTAYRIGSSSYYDNYPLINADIYSLDYHVPIQITGNSELLTFPEKAGAGTIPDPFVIEKFVISAMNIGSCISIQGTSIPLMIKDCILLTSQQGTMPENIFGGIKIVSGTNLTIENCLLIANNGAGLILDQASNITVHDVYANYNQLDGIHISRGHGILVSHNSYSFNYENGLFCNDSHNITFLENDAIGNTKHGAFLNATYDISIDTEVFRSNTQDGLNVGWSTNLSIQGLIASLNHYNGANLESSSNISIIGNQFAYNALAGILCTNSNEIFIATNTVDHNTQDGIRILTSSEVIARDNQVNSNNLNGMQFKSIKLIVLSNNTCRANNFDGIQINESSDIAISNNTFEENNQHGLHLVALSNNNITLNENVAQNNHDCGINVENSNWVIIDLSICTDNEQCGICLSGSSNCSIMNSILYHCSSYGIQLLSSADIAISNNTLEENLEHGIYLAVSSHITMNENIVKNNHDCGINVVNSTWITIVHSICIDNEQCGIFLFGSSDCIIANNTLSNCSAYGIQLIYASRIEVSYNNVTEHTIAGIYGDESGSLQIVENNCSFNTGNGLMFLSMSGTIVDNTAMYNGENGIDVLYSNGVTIRENDVLWNAEDGIAIYISVLMTVSNNTCLHNAFNGILLFATETTTIKYNIVDYNMESGIEIVDSSSEIETFENEAAFNYENGVCVNNAGSINIHDNNATLNSGNGIDASNSDTLTISGNFLQQNNFDGINCLIITGSLIEGNLISENGQHGISFNLSQGTTIVSNVITDNDGCGVYMLESYENQVCSNFIENNHQSGLSLIRSDNNYFLANLVRNNNWNGMELQDSNSNTIEDQILRFNLYDGISLVHSWYSRVSNNTISQNNQNGLSLTNDSNNCIITANYVTYNLENGIFLDNASFNTISQNLVIENVKNGIMLSRYSNENHLNGNEILRNQKGILLIRSSYNVIESNIAFDNYFEGVDLLCVGAEGCIYNNLYGNNISSNGGNGLSINGSSYNAVFQNFISQNTGTGIELFGSSNANEFVKNHIGHNVLVQVYCHASFSGLLNSWDNGTIGNYYSDYTARYPLATHNGLTWSIPYEIDHSRSIFDYHPLVSPRCTSCPVVDFTASTIPDYIQRWIRFTFTGLYGDMPSSFQWNFGDGSQNSTLVNPLHKYTASGFFSVTLTIVDRDGDAMTRRILNIVYIIDLEPSVTLHANQTSIYVSHWVRFNVTGELGDYPASFTWNFGDGTPLSHVAEPEHYYSTVGDFTVTVVVADGDGDDVTVTNSNYIHVVEPPATVHLSACFEASPVNVGTGEELTLRFNGTLAGSWVLLTWDFGDGSNSTQLWVSTDENSTLEIGHRFDVAGHYTVRLVATNSEGENSTFTSSVEVRYVITFTPDETAGIGIVVSVAVVVVVIALIVVIKNKNKKSHAARKAAATKMENK